MVNVKTFGALGDGIHDDTANIQAAIDSLPTDTSRVYGGIVLVPTGIYLVSSDILLPNGVELRGEGPTATYIRAKSGVTFTKAIIRNKDSSGGQEFVYVSDLQVQCVKAGAAITPVGILFDTVFANSRIENVVVVDSSGIGIQVKCVNSPSLVQNSGPVYINNCWVTRCNGHNIEVLGQVNTCWITNTTTENTPTGKAGIHIKGPLNAGILGGFTSGLGNVIQNVHFENPTPGAYAVWLEDAPFVTIDNLQSSASDRTTIMVWITGALVEDLFHSVQICCRNIVCGPGIAIKDDTRGVTIMTACSNYATGKLFAFSGLGVGNSVASTATRTKIREMEVFDATGASLGFIDIRR